jgi:hypothetical protein
MCVYFEFRDLLKNIFNKKFSKHNHVNILSYEIKNLDLYLTLDFLGFIFKYR